MPLSRGRLRPEPPNHVWSYDFVEGRTCNGGKFGMFNITDEFTRDCLTIRIDHKPNSTDVIDVLSNLFILRGVPGHGGRGLSIIQPSSSAAICAETRSGAASVAFGPVT